MIRMGTCDRNGKVLMSRNQRGDVKRRNDREQRKQPGEGRNTELKRIPSGRAWQEQIEPKQKRATPGKEGCVILIGMPASGKSTAGVILAKVLGMDFLDTDLLIQRRTGKKLPDLIKEYGVDGFLRIEEQVCCQVLAGQAVIATGGSAVYGERAMEHLRRIGTIVYLDVPYPELQRRLKDVNGRGVVMRPGQTLEELYRERIPLYEKYADIIVRETGSGVESIVIEIAEKWQRFRKGADQK